jgi:hypothetical protein
MINVNLDEGYVFDMLSILKVKISHASGDNLFKIYSAYELMENQIINQIGSEKYHQVVESQEYTDLLQSNALTFSLVDKTKKDNGLAKQVDDANYKRYLCKTALQKKFFQSDASETKIGY